MTEELKNQIEDMMMRTRAARNRLWAAQIALETKKHKIRSALYAQKESGERKLTEEQIRSISMVETEAENIAFLNTQADYENAKESLEVLKLIASN